MDHTTPQHTIETRQRDIEFGNAYRIEYIKHLVSVAAGIFAFTISFMRDYLGKSADASTAKPLLAAGWVLLVVSIIAGIFHMRYWAWYFTSWGRGPGDDSERNWRNTVDVHRKIAEYSQLASFFGGVALIALFASINLWT